MALIISGTRAAGAKVFRAIDEVLRADPRLAAAGVRFASYRAGEDPNDTRLSPPAIKLTPRPSGMGWFTVGQHQISLGIDVTLIVDGSDVADLYTLWEGVLNALFAEPGTDRTRIDRIRERVEDGLDLDLTLEATQWPGVDDALSTANRCLVGIGTLVATFIISTQE